MRGSSCEVWPWIARNMTILSLSRFLPTPGHSNSLICITELSSAQMLNLLIVFFCCFLHSAKAQIGLGNLYNNYGYRPLTSSLGYGSYGSSPYGSYGSYGASPYGIYNGYSPYSYGMPVGMGNTAMSRLVIITRLIQYFILGM